MSEVSSPPYIAAHLPRSHLTLPLQGDFTLIWCHIYHEGPPPPLCRVPELSCCLIALTTCKPSCLCLSVSLVRREVSLGQRSPCKHVSGGGGGSGGASKEPALQSVTLWYFRLSLMLLPLPRNLRCL